MLIAALIASAGLVALTVFTLRPPDVERDEEARGHAEAACDLTAKADEAAHRGRPGQWLETLDDALAACHESVR